MKSAKEFLKNHLPILSIFLISTLLSVFTTQVVAYELDSTNFRMIGVTTSGGGGVLESNNYNILSEMGRITADPRNYSANYRMDQDPSIAFVAEQPSIQCFEADTDGTTDCTSGPQELLDGGMVAICGGNGCYDKARFEIEENTNPADTLYGIEISTDDFVSDIRCIDGSTFYPKSLPNCDINDFRTESYWENEDFNIGGLESDTEYYLRITALHGDFTQSDYSIVRTATTAIALLYFDIDIGVKNEGELITEDLVLHLDADAITGLDDNDQVETWEDLSGNNNDATQSLESKRPIYKTDSLNGRPAIRFEGQAGEHSLELPDFASSFSEGEIFAVIWIKNDPPGHSNDSGIWRFGTPGTNTHYPFTNGSSYLSWGKNSREGPITNAIGSLETPHILNISSGEEWTMYQNGNLAYNTSPNTVGFRSNPAIGESPGGDRWLDGYFAEIAMYDRVLSQEERGLVEEYLGIKWLGWPENNVESSPPHSVSFTGEETLIAGSAAVTASSLIWLDVDSSSSGGMAVIKSGVNGGLHSATTAETIPSSNIDLDTSLAEGFGLQSYYINYESSAYLGSISAAPNYTGSGNVIGEVSTTPQKIYEGNGPINTGRMGIYLKARASSERSAATDYSEKINFVLVPKY